MCAIGGYQMAYGYLHSDRTLRGSLEVYPIAQNIQTLLSAVILAEAGPGTRVRGRATFGPEMS